MAGDLRPTTIGEAADILTGFPFKSDEFSENSNDLRLLRGDNVIQGKMRWDGVKRWQNNNVKQYQEYILRPGDVVLAMDRPWIEAGLKHATLTEADCPSLLVQRVARLRARPGLDQRFLGYLIHSSNFSDYILRVQTGTAVPHISGSQIKSYGFLLPPLHQQIAIAALLGFLDDKIEVNRKTAETLEAMARALFKSWFVDFDPVHARVEGRPTGLPDNVAALFPDRFGTNGMPNGWHTLPLGTIAELDRTTCNPSELQDEVVSHFSIPAFDNGRRPTLEAASEIKSLKLRLTPPVILFSKLNPTTPRLWPVLSTVDRPALASTEYLAFHPAQRATSYAYLAMLLSSQPFVARAASMVTGTSKSHQRVQADSLLATIWLVPPIDVLGQFDLAAAVLLSRADTARSQCETLAALRNTLLPKLISGELRISDAEQRVAAA